MQLYYEASMHPNLDNEEKWLTLPLMPGSVAL